MGYVISQSHIVLALVQNLRPGGRFEQESFAQKLYALAKGDRTKGESKSEDKGENRSIDVLKQGFVRIGWGFAG